ncbi:hypothetical protein B9479_002340 [Cryptococcus floricola]|uniref:Uncharacterized protein n=1 Tax=Cryptococcus floricola TaxID=2591691 RepID=A0A5D3AZX5_9TREE|nr:hypothetical protein B9479_002340 [Cryptococcus floricola]
MSSSPLNPFSHPPSVPDPQQSRHAPSSSPPANPMSSPTPFFRRSPGGLESSSGPGLGKGKLSTRYTRPARKSLPSALPSYSPAGPSNGDLFSEGTTPLEGAMWRERFTRRMDERENRKKAKERNLEMRRGIGRPLFTDDIEEDEDELERKEKEDDDEIYRRITILQRKKAVHAQLVNEEYETGGSDPNLPDFWENELEQMQREERDLIRRLEAGIPEGIEDEEEVPEELVREAEEIDMGEGRGMNMDAAVEEDEWDMDVTWEEMEVARKVEEEAFGASGNLRRSDGDGMDID